MKEKVVLILLASVGEMNKRRCLFNPQKEVAMKAIMV